MTELGPAQWAALAVALLRVAELAHARRNTRRLLAEGGIEHGRRHYPLFVLLHGSWLAALFLLVDPAAPVRWPLLLLFAGLQFVRLWIVASLGRYWTTRIVTVPGTPLVRHGPYRWLRHPNYLLVAAELPLLPLAFGATALAATFGLANLALLGWRIRVEDAALRPRRQAPLPSVGHPS